jgi:hypothetical protein
LKRYIFPIYLKLSLLDNEPLLKQRRLIAGKKSSSSSGPNKSLISAASTMKDLDEAQKKEASFFHFLLSFNVVIIE